MSPFNLYIETRPRSADGAFTTTALSFRSTVEEFLRQQYATARISATIGPDYKVDKATVVSDEETSTIVDAAGSLRSMPDQPG